MHILIEDESYTLRAKDLSEGKVRFTDFAASCPKCNAKLEEGATIQGNKLNCECGHSIDIVDDKPKTISKPTKETKPVKDSKPVKPAKETKPEKKEAKPVKDVKKVEPTKPAKEVKAAKESKPVKPAKEAKSEKESAKRGAMTQKIQQTDRFKAREGSYNQIIGDFFKSPKIPLNIKDKILDAMKGIKDKSAAHTKDPYGYARGYITKMLKNGILETIE